MPKQDLPQSAQKKKNFRMPDIYIILGIFILLMAVLTYIVPSGQYDRHVVETVHGVQNLVVANTYHAVEPSSRMALRSSRLFHMALNVLPVLSF